VHAFRTTRCLVGQASYQPHACAAELLGWMLSARRLGASQHWVGARQGPCRRHQVVHHHLHPHAPRCGGGRARCGQTPPSAVARASPAVSCCAPPHTRLRPRKRSPAWVTPSPLAGARASTRLPGRPALSHQHVRHQPGTRLLLAPGEPRPASSAAAGMTYCHLLERLAKEDPPAFICHFYNFYFAHTAGGRMIGSKVRRWAEGRQRGRCVRRAAAMHSTCRAPLLALTRMLVAMPLPLRCPACCWITTRWSSTSGT
jgi:hypothetical protein